MQTQISFYVIKRLKHASEKSNSAEYTVPLLFPLILSKPHFLTHYKQKNFERSVSNLTGTAATAISVFLD